LERLGIRIDESDWLDRANFRANASKKFESVTNMPGYGVLAKIRGLKDVQFFACPTIEQLLKEVMLSPKEMGKKRKRAGGDEQAVVKKAAK
jgi:hypothetical protein